MFQRPLTLILLQEHRDANGSGLHYFLPRGRHNFVKVVAIEMGDVPSPSNPFYFFSISFLFWGVFLYFPKKFRGSAKSKTLAFFGVSLVFFCFFFFFR